ADPVTAQDLLTPERYLSCIRAVVDKIRYGQYLWGSGRSAASALSELFDEQHSYLIVELSGARDGKLDTHGESRPREGFHVQAGAEGDLGPVILGDGGRGCAELDERGEPSGHRPGGGKPAVERLGVLGLECPCIGHLAEE